MRAGEAVWIGHHEAGTPEWDEARRGRLGGSEIAAVMGMSPWTSPFALWHRKAGTLPGQPRTDRLRIGQLLEDAVVTLYVERTGNTVRRTGMWANADRPWQVAAPDRFVTAGPRRHLPVGIFEAKTANGMTAWEWGPDGTSQGGFAWDSETGQWLGNVPPYYVAQVQWYLDTFGLPWADLGVLLGFEYRQYRVDHDPASCALMRSQAEAFLAALAAGEPPDVDASTATYEALRALHPELDGTDVELDPDLATGFLTAKRALTDAEQAWAAHRNQVADRMGSATTASLAGTRVAVRKAKGTTGRPWVEAARTAT